MPTIKCPKCGQVFGVTSKVGVFKCPNPTCPSYVALTLKGKVTTAKSKGNFHKAILARYKPRGGTTPPPAIEMVETGKKTRVARVRRKGK